MTAAVEADGAPLYSRRGRGLAAEDDFYRNLSFFFEYDSMAGVELVVRLEEEFGIKITDAEAGRARTVADLVGLVWGKLRQRNS